MIKKFKIYESIPFDVKLDRGDVIVLVGLEISIDTIWIYNRYETFYQPNRRVFSDIHSPNNYDTFTLEKFYEEYPEITVDAFIEIVDNSDPGAVWNAHCENLKNVWLERIPSLQIHIETDKYNL